MGSPDANASQLALRTGLPFGAVMATRAAAQVARPIGWGWADQPLLWMAVAEICFITARGIVRHTTVLRWTSLVAALAGLAGYWILLPVAGARVARYRLSGSEGVLWWISAGCGGLAAAATAKALGAIGPDSGGRLIVVLRPLTEATWLIAAALLIPIIAGSTRFLGRQLIAGRTFPWPPTFSTAVFALGGLGAGTLAGNFVIGDVGRIAGYVTLAGW